MGKNTSRCELTRTFPVSLRPRDCHPYLTHGMGRQLRIQLYFNSSQLEGSMIMLMPNVRLTMYVRR